MVWRESFPRFGNTENNLRQASSVRALIQGQTTTPIDDDGPTNTQQDHNNDNNNNDNNNNNKCAATC